MKSSVLILLAALLTMAILVPSVVTLVNADETVIAIDFNDEEKKEEKKEEKVKNYFLDSNLNSFAHYEGLRGAISSFYIEGDYMASLGVFLPPPEHTL